MGIVSEIYVSFGANGKVSGSVGDASPEEVARVLREFADRIEVLAGQARDEGRVLSYLDYDEGKWFSGEDYPLNSKV